MQDYSEYLARLKPHQVDGLYEFIKWFKGGKQFGILAGCGGSGKTHSIMIYAQAANILPEDILACAPTNAAAKKLGESMGMGAKTIHSAYGILPVKRVWTQEHQDKYNKIVEQLADDSIDHELRAKLTKDELVLKIISKASSANELAFLPRDLPDKDLDPLPTDEDAQCEAKLAKLIVVDEASMVSKEVISWIEAFTDPKVKVLFMGDERQLPPVDDGDKISPAFAYHQIAKFEHSVRSEAGSSLYKLIDKIRYIDEPTSQVAVLEMLDDPDNVITIGEDEAVLVSGKRKRQLVEHFAKTLKADGLEWRILAYRNATVDNWNHAAKVSSGTPYFGLGDAMVARSGFSRYGQFYGKRASPLKLLVNNAQIKLGDFCGSGKVRTGFLSEDFFEYQKYNYSYNDEDTTLHAKEIEEHHDDKPYGDLGIKTAEINPDIFNHEHFLNYIRGNTKFENPTLTGGMNASFIKQLIVISPKDLPKYQAACEYWTKLSKSFGMATKNPEASDTIREFMETTMSVVLDISLDKPKPIREWFNTRVKSSKPETDPISNLVRLKKYCANVSQKLNNLTDDIVYPFASTIHKSQGQTIDNVLFDVRDVGTINFGSKDLLCRAIYTGVSRAAKRLIVLM